MVSTVAKMKNSLKGLRSRFDTAEEINSAFEDRSIETVQLEEQREKE